MFSSGISLIFAGFNICNNARLEFSTNFVPRFDPNEWCLKIISTVGVWTHNLLVISLLPKPLDHGYSPIIKMYLLVA
jgi:hypothetical protein